jgi:hypothetical protein
VPFSIELRNTPVRFAKVREAREVTSELMFPANNGAKWEQRNALRSLYCMLKRLGLPKSGFHRLRHTFATQYLKNGGDVVRLSIILGHSEISTTMKYLHLLTEGLQRPHQSLSILNRLPMTPTSLPPLALHRRGEVEGKLRDQFLRWMNADAITTIPTSPNAAGIRRSTFTNRSSTSGPKPTSKSVEDLSRSSGTSERILVVVKR